MRDAPLLIAQLDPPHASREGDWYYRTYVPGRAMAEAPGVYVVNLDNVHRRRAAVLREADVVVLNSVVDPDLLPVLAERRRRRLLTVYELSDDVSAVPPWNPVHSFFRNRDNVHLFLRLARECDADQYSVEELRRLYGYLNPRGQVFPNQLAEVPPLPAPTDRGELVVGWGGSKGHLEDLAAVAGPLMDWVEARPGVVLHLMCAEAIWQLFERLPPSRRRRTLPGSIHDYYAFLRGLDVGLAPLCDNGFNRSRSDVKFLEYAAHGVAPVLQRLVPYLGTAVHRRTCLFFDDAAGLVAALDELAADPALRRALGAAAHAEIAAGRTQRQHAGARLSFYRSLLAQVGHAPREEDEVRALFEGLLQGDGVEASGRHALLGGARFERLLHDGLVLSQQQGRRAEGARLFEEAARLEPGDHLPHLCLAAAGLEPVAALGRALARNPASVQSLVALGTHHALRGEIAEAIERLLVAMVRCPSWEVPCLRLAQVLREAGQVAEADRFTRRAADLLRPLQPA